VPQPCADFPKRNQGERRENSARITGDARPGKTSPKRLNSRGHCAVPGRPRPRGSSAARTSRPRGRYGGHPGQEAASQLSPHRRGRTVVGHDRPRTCRATPTTDCQVDGQECGQAGRFGQGRAVACGDRHGGCCWAGSALEDRRSWPGRPVRMARTLSKNNPQEPRPGGQRADPPAPGRWAPGGHQRPEELPWPSRVSLERVLVLRPEGRVNLTAATAGGATHRQAVRRPDPSALLAGTPTRISRSSRVGPSGRSGI
jgi:hypothetical protein